MNRLRQARRAAPWRCLPAAAAALSALLLAGCVVPSASPSPSVLQVLGDPGDRPGEGRGHWRVGRPQARGTPPPAAAAPVMGEARPRQGQQAGPQPGPPTGLNTAQPSGAPTGLQATPLADALTEAHAAARALWQPGTASFAQAIAHPLDATAAEAQDQAVGGAAPSAAEDAGAAPGALVLARPDDRAPARSLTGTLFGRPVVVRLGYEGSVERRSNFDLNRPRNRDRLARDHEFKLEARLSPRERWLLMAEVVGVVEDRIQTATGARDRTEGLQRGQMWLLVERPFGWQPAGWDVALQGGRIALVDRRAFWWDEDIDALRLIARRGDWRWETGLGRELFKVQTQDPGIDIAHRGVWRWFGQGAWDWRERQRLEAFWLLAVDRSGRPPSGSRLAAADRDDEDARLLWLGLRASGRLDPEGLLAAGKLRIEYWADAALVAGHAWRTAYATQADGSALAGATVRRRVQGQAFDVGLQARWRGLPFTPSLQAAAARGSGRADSATGPLGFRQTGLHENKARLGGVKRLRRYGELLDPELANLQVLTLGAALRPSERSSIELVWHRYRQAVASSLLPGARVSELPGGLDPDIGRELDLFLAWRESEHLELTLSLSRFLPGPAFAPNRRDRAHAVELGAALQF